MATITSILNTISELKSRIGKYSIGKNDLFGLLSDMVKRQQSTELNMSNLSLRKIYASIAAMNADVAAPVGDDGEKVLKGQLVVISAVGADMGKVYRYSGTAWEYVGLIGDVSQKANLTDISTYNVSSNFPLEFGTYYTLETAIEAVPISVRKKGLVITFESEKSFWQTWKFMAYDMYYYNHTDYWRDERSLYEKELQSTDDLNTIIRDGIYFYSENSLPLNCPTPKSSFLSVESAPTGVYAVQTAYNFNNDNFIYYRIIYKNSPQYNTPWANLRKITSKETDRQMSYNGILNNANDLNDVSSLKSGIYLIQSSSMPENSPTLATSILSVDTFLDNYQIQTVREFDNPEQEYVRTADIISLNNTNWRNGRALYEGELKDTNDLNLILKDGFYFYSENSLPLNCPTPKSSFLSVQSAPTGVYAIQTAYNFNNDNFIYYRIIHKDSPQYNTTWANLRTITSKETDRQMSYNGILNSANDLNDVSSLKSGLYLIQNLSIPENHPALATSILTVDTFLDDYQIQTVREFDNPEQEYVRTAHRVSSNNTSWYVKSGNLKLNGKKVVTLGDSITYSAQATIPYQNQINRLTGADVINLGYSGTAYAMRTTDQEPWNSNGFYHHSINLDLTDIDILWIMYGTNDFGNGYPIGTISSDEFTVSGAIYKGLTNIFTRKPSIKIIASLPIYTATINGVTVVDPDIEVNAIGKKMIDYVEAITTVYKKFRIPIFDAWHECGINHLNHTTFLEDKLHPNNAGNELIGIRFAHFISQY